MDVLQTPSFPFFFQATATEDVAESLSPDDGECFDLDLDFSSFDT